VIAGYSNFMGVYNNGACPHYEIQNDGSSTNACVLIEDVVCRSMADFLAPE
jgi:hypothetical protein